MEPEAKFESPQRVIEYHAPPPAAAEAWLRPSDVCLLCAFAVYAAANVFLVAHAIRPGEIFFIFAVPLPLMFIVFAILARYLASPPLFNRWILLAVLLLVILEAIGNIYVALASI